MAVVITNPEMGIYLGNCMGMGFWTKLDPAGQPSAVTFPDEISARKHVATWEERGDPALYGYAPVKPSDGGYASIADLKAAGLGDLLGNMEDDALRFAEPAGMA